jgi:hypothetical protein
MEFINGISTHGTWDIDLMKAAGIGWVRAGFPYPFADPQTEAFTDEYQRAREHAHRWSDAGFKLVGGTPGLGHGTYQPGETGKLRMVFHSALPDWMGAPGSEEYYRHYDRGCAFLAKDVGRIAPLWQVGNELDIPQFAGPLNLRQASELILRTVIAMKTVNPDLLVSTNISGGPTTYYFLGRLFDDPRVRLDYCGIDQYYGSWQPGDPQTWAERIDELYALTGGVPIFINEWGYSSAGALMTHEERQLGMPYCQLKKWAFGWDAGHTPEVQAEFIRRTMDVFVQKHEKLLGQCFFRWEDTETCWQCGKPDCPVETAWGLVDVKSNPKPAYTAFKDGVGKLSG